MKRIIILMQIMLALSSSVSCSLDEDTSAVSTPEKFFRNYSECQSVVNGCYMPIRSIYNYTYMIATECVSDLAYCPSGTLDASLDISPSVPRFGSTVWTQGYLGVQRCNFAVNGLARAHESQVISNEEYYQLMCEAKVLRGFYYWTLSCFFGDVPFYFDDVSDNKVLMRVSMMPRMNANATRDSIISDLQTIAPLATQTRTSDNEENRLGAACAYMIIAKMAMWNKEWNTALDALKKIEYIYGNLSKYDYLENVMFRNKNTPESIMEVQHTYTQGGLSYTSNVACICQPYPRSANSDVYDGVEVPELGNQATVWSAMRPNVYFCQGLQSRMSKDIRAKVNMAWDYNGVSFKNTNTRPWCGPKFWCPDMQSGNDGNNYKVFRYADAILMISECYYNLGDYEQSVKYLNMTRIRAGLDGYTYRTPVRLAEEIRNERGRELFGEFQRKYDLVRWGIWYDAVTSNSDYSYLQLNNANSRIKPCHRYYPIPDTEVTYSRYNLDNKEYNEYGL